MRSKTYRTCSSCCHVLDLLVLVFFDLVQFKALYRYRKSQVLKKYSRCIFLKFFLFVCIALCLVTLEEAFGDLDKKTNSKIKLVVDKASLEDELGDFPQLLLCFINPFPDPDPY
jgi:hypothetical protein